jgi:NAD(P)H-dependent flavin oxidoreductase YrpB (nitropropane dioxygenase family)
VANYVANYLARDEVTRPDGFVIEAPTAGGHNAPPRGKLVLDDDGQPVYGPRDEVDPTKFLDLGLPFWLAGGWGSPSRLQEALALGAAGIQVGTLFAMSQDSGFRPDLRERLRTSLIDGTLRTRTDPLASPTGFPFKVAQLPDAVGLVSCARSVRCLRPATCASFRRRQLDYRCASEPDHTFTRRAGPGGEGGRVCSEAQRPAAGLAGRVDSPRRRLDGFRPPARGYDATTAIAWLRGGLTPLRASPWP